ISLAEASKVVAQIGKIGLFTKLVDEIAGVAREIPRLYDRISTTSSSGHPSIDTKHNRPGRRWPKKGGEVIGSDRGQGLVVIVLLIKHLKVRIEGTLAQLLDILRIIYVRAQKL